MLVLAGLTLGLVSGTFSHAAASGLYATGLWATNGPSTLPTAGSIPSRPGGPGGARSATATPPAAPSSTTTEGLPDPVLVAATAGKPPRAAEVADRVRAVKVKGMGGSYSGAVLDVGSGKTLFAHHAGQAYIPASTMKLLTSTAALSVLGPEHRFRTTVVAPSAGRIILVGGGDPYLTAKAVDDPQSPASLADLARSSATALKKKGVSRVKLGYDDSLFTGPAWNKTWPSSYGDVVTPISALWADEGVVKGSRASNPSKAAAAVFAAALRKRGIKVSGLAAAQAKTHAPVVASVESATLDRIVEHLLMVSDNSAAEVVLRQAAVGAKRSGSFTAGVDVVRSRLTKLGAWAPGTKIYDGSGLSRSTHVPAETMVELLRLAAGKSHPELRGVITGLPVAGVEGSLRSKFYDQASEAGRGLVRGKTGTLREVHSLAGFVRARDGSMMVYAFLVNKPKNEFAAVVWLQQVTAALSECGCR